MSTLIATSDPFLRPSAVAADLGISVVHTKRLSRRGILPPFVKLAGEAGGKFGAVGMRKSRLDAFKAARDAEGVAA